MRPLDASLVQKARSLGAGCGQVRPRPQYGRDTMAGLSRMPLWKFFLADIAGVLIWGCSIMAIGLGFRTQIEYVGELAAHLGAWAIAIVGAVVAFWLAWKQWQRRRFIASLKVARITPEEVLQRLSKVGFALSAL